MSPIGWIIAIVVVVVVVVAIAMVISRMVDATKGWPFIFVVAAWIVAFSFPLVFVFVALFAEEVNKFVLDALKER